MSVEELKEEVDNAIQKVRNQSILINNNQHLYIIII